MLLSKTFFLLWVISIEVCLEFLGPNQINETKNWNVFLKKSKKISFQKIENFAKERKKIVGCHSNFWRIVGRWKIVEFLRSPKNNTWHQFACVSIVSFVAELKTKNFQYNLISYVSVIGVVRLQQFFPDQRSMLFIIERLF